MTNRIIVTAKKNLETLTAISSETIDRQTLMQSSESSIYPDMA